MKKLPFSQSKRTQQKRSTMKIIGKVMTIVAILMFTGCATTYQPAGLSGGYQEKELENNVYQITFSGNSFISKEKINDFGMFRCAEFSLEHEKPYFEVVSKDLKSIMGKPAVWIQIRLYETEPDKTSLKGESFEAEKVMTDIRTKYPEDLPQLAQ